MKGPRGSSRARSTTPPPRWPRPHFPPEGLLATVVQDARDGTVLMVAYSNADSWRQLRRTGALVLFSRSRQELWRKGATSGNTARVLSASLDCDGDALLLKVVPKGPMCHTGRRSCFGDVLPLEEGQVAPLLARLEALVAARRTQAPRGSYTRRLLEDESHRLKKVGEEASELVVAAAQRDRGQVVWEAADLLYHLTVLLGAAGVPWSEVQKELARREGEPRRARPSPPRGAHRGRR
jgi:phosphoribosyl-AMP cyclohydrolase / phosphoribosyl-ATP pyrophosphohydrolase